MEPSALSFIEDALAALERSVHDRDSALRNVQLATVSLGGQPNLRTLVLRAFGRSPPSAEMHSDARAAKVRDIAHSRRVGLLAWSSPDRLQLRFEGTAALHRDDEVARSRWDKLSPNARNIYGFQSEPGHRITDPADQEHLPPEEQFRQFTVILVTLNRMDVLRLDLHGGQTRAGGLFTPAGLAAEWRGP